LRSNGTVDHSEWKRLVRYLRDVVILEACDSVIEVQSARGFIITSESVSAAGDGDRFPATGSGIERALRASTKSNPTVYSVGWPIVVFPDASGTLQAAPLLIATASVHDTNESCEIQMESDFDFNPALMRADDWGGALVQEVVGIGEPSAGEPPRVS
jgi:hypothetical protein